MTLLLLARHGETDWNRDGIWQGHANQPLNELGRRQSRELAARLAGVELAAIYSSDLRRALETAEIVAAARSLTVVADPGLREMDVGSWTGLTGEQIAERFPRVAYHDGETRDAFQARVVSTVTRIARVHEGEQQLLIVAHGGIVRAVQRHSLGEPLPVLENCATYAFRFEGGVFRPID